jgi:hypothetical protein
LEQNLDTTTTVILKIKILKRIIFFESKRKQLSGNLIAKTEQLRELIDFFIFVLKHTDQRL